ncbi:MAG: hypothetical protein QNK23_12280 [Crocinitomicaceae bacterium]|nr:hypothetical protein [Crocinitomicaceae bacterium]
MPAEKDMYPFVYMSLRVRYPKKEGWEIVPQYRGASGTYIPDFLVYKKGRKWKYVIPVEVKDECVAKQADIDQLNRYALSLTGQNVKLHAKIMVYPGGADTSIVPSDIVKMYTTTYYCNNATPPKMVKRKLKN